MNKNEIKTKFDRYIKGFIFNDICHSIKAKTNFLTALGLLSYTEFLGGLISGNGGKNDYSRKNFYVAYNLLGPDYITFDKQICQKYKNSKGKPRDFYDLVRCGLVHEYFIKKDFIIARDNYSTKAPGVGWTNQKIGIANSNYFRDFKKMCSQYKKDLMKNQKLQENFSKVFAPKNYL
jgi:hypothetical protein